MGNVYWNKHDNCSLWAEDLTRFKIYKIYENFIKVEEKVDSNIDTQRFMHETKYVS